MTGRRRGKGTGLGEKCEEGGKRRSSRRKIAGFLLPIYVSFTSLMGLPAFLKQTILCRSNDFDHVSICKYLGHSRILFKCNLKESILLNWVCQMNICLHLVQRAKYSHKEGNFIQKNLDICSSFYYHSNSALYNMSLYYSPVFLFAVFKNRKKTHCSTGKKRKYIMTIIHIIWGEICNHFTECCYNQKW